MTQLLNMGLIEVMNVLPVSQIWTNGAIHTTDTFEMFLDTIAARQILYFEAERGSAIRVGELETRFLVTDSKHRKAN
ncbi:MAG: hypothetical protein HY862_02600 [Chloroflexi bacterium]|nr:hypothetical protein [Chloroflexota bacterium]